MDSGLPLVGGYWKHTFDIDHIFSHTLGRISAFLATNNLALKPYGQVTYPPCDYNKFPYANLPTALPPPQDEYITNMVPNMSACIISNPRTAKTLVPFYEFSPPQFCPWVIFHP